MSAYILDNTELKNIVEAFGKIAGFSISSQTNLFNLLHSENVTSVNYRYIGSRNAAIGGACQETPERPAILSDDDFLKVASVELTRGEALNRLTSLIYQSCEHSGYFDSLAYETTARMAAAFISGIDEHKTENRIFSVYRHFSNFHSNEEYISVLSEASDTSGAFEFTGSGLKKVTKSISYVSFNPNTDSTIQNALGEHILKKKVEHESGFLLSNEQLLAMQETAKEEQAARLRQAAIETAQREAEKAAFLEQLKTIYKADTHMGFILAEYEIDDCDSMTDYFSTKTDRRIILALSNHSRALVPEMRKAILNSGLDIPELLEVAEKNEKFEHRNGGYYGNKVYLKNGSTYSSGWRISKVKIYSESCFPVSEFAPVLVSSLEPEQKEPDLTIQGVQIEEHTHTKKNFQMFICIFPKMSKADYFLTLDKARSAGGWYSRQWGTTPGGFAFKEKASAESFAQSLEFGTIQETKEGKTPVLSKVNANHGEKLRGLAEGLQKQIDDKRGPRLTNTPKRLKEANNARNEAERLERTQKALYALAEIHHAGNVPALLAGFTSKKAVYDAMSGKNELIENGHHCYYSGTGKPASDKPEILALWALLGGETEESKKEKILQSKIDSLQFANIPGYFPTPKSVIDLMLENASIKPGYKILEPSAGSGAILDEIKERHPKTTLEACEVNYTLREVLTLKGFNVIEHNFLELEKGGYDAVLMNPPFENLQDIEHIKHAYELLKEGGRLVAIMSPSAFFRMDKKSEAFRSWFYSLSGLETDLPENSFKQSGTSVNTKMIVLNK